MIVKIKNIYFYELECVYFLVKIEESVKGLMSANKNVNNHYLELN